MAGQIIWYITNFGCATLFYLIGVYAKNLKKPMHFWSGSEIDSYLITDVKAYNRENAIMWKHFSLCFVVSGFLEIVNPNLALIVFLLSFAIGIPTLICIYLRIYNKYKR
ncbi:MAG: hypothetical protein E7582_06660 [Ruminococcaceae bacterium]|nr:hypothetical protein [Oscillospiraceae bacterium]